MLLDCISDVPRVLYQPMLTPNGDLHKRISTNHSLSSESSVSVHQPSQAIRAPTPSNSSTKAPELSQAIRAPIQTNSLFRVREPSLTMGAPFPSELSPKGHGLSQAIRTSNSSGSGSLPYSILASRKSAALTQPRQPTGFRNHPMQVAQQPLHRSRAPIPSESSPQGRRPGHAITASNSSGPGSAPRSTMASRQSAALIQPSWPIAVQIPSAQVAQQTLRNNHSQSEPPQIIQVQNQPLQTAFVGFPHFLRSAHVSPGDFSISARAVRFIRRHAYLDSGFTGMLPPSTNSYSLCSNMITVSVQDVV
jgi:hypothetical protein